MRRIYKLNIRTHTYTINDIACTVKILLHKKTRFIYSLSNSSNSYMSCILPHLLIKNTSLLSENYFKAESYL